MVTPNEAKEVLAKAGIKYKKLAMETGIHKSWISEWINGWRILDQMRLLKIEAYLNKVKEIL